MLDVASVALAVGIILIGVATFRDSALLRGVTLVGLGIPAVAVGTEQLGLADELGLDMVAMGVPTLLVGLAAALHGVI